MSRVPRFFAALTIATTMALAASACSSEEPSTSTDAADAPSSQIETTAPEQTEPVTASTPEEATADPVVPAVEPASASIPPVPSRDDVNVDARDFEQGDGQYFFKSPSGNAYCAFNSSNAPGTVVGCQVRESVPGDTGRVCLNTENNTYGVQIKEGGVVEQICTNQGIFVANEVPVLEYGQVIGVTSTICRSTEAGIACYAGTGSGFMISRDVNVTF